MTEFLFDTYALFEILRGNPSYKPYADEKAVINHFILFEFGYHLLKEFDSKTAFRLVDQQAPFVALIDPQIVKEAALFRHANKEKSFSQTDCVSYVQAKKMGIRFLTGDQQFEGLSNVEFVK